MHARFSGFTLEVKTLSKAHFQQRRRPCRHSDERAAERSPGSSRFIHVAISHAFEFDNSQKNKLRVIEIFCWTRTAFFDTLATQSGEISRKIRLMKTCSLIAVGAVFMILSHLAGATQADDTTITITGHTAGATPFISKLTLEVSNTTVLKSIQFAIDPKPGSVTRPLSGTYSNDYLVSRGFEHPPEIILPVYGLYAGYQNIVRLTYRFLDGSSKQAVTSVTTATFDDQGLRLQQSDQASTQDEQHST